jgi:hypothetical protein
MAPAAAAGLRRPVFLTDSVGSRGPKHYDYGYDAVHYDYGYDAVLCDAMFGFKTPVRISDTPTADHTSDLPCGK